MKDESIGWQPQLQRHEDDATPIRAVGRMIVLVGLMGAGKNYIGKRLAARLDRPFLDADAEIELAAGCSIAEIFARMGEPAFRAGERRVIARLLEGTPGVLATGGGAFMDPETRRNVAERGVSVWLRADLDVLVRRTAGRSHRPILNSGNPRDVLAELMAKRSPTYGLADIIIDANERPAESTVDAVLAALAETKVPQSEISA